MRLIAAILAIVMCGCTPYMTYQELHDSYYSATNAEEKESLKEKIEKRERLGNEADVYYSIMDQCTSGSGKNQTMMYCKRSEYMGPGKDLDRSIRNYRRDKHNCYCVLRSDIIEQIRGR